MSLTSFGHCYLGDILDGPAVCDNFYILAGLSSLSMAKHTACKLPKIWNLEHGIRSTNCIYISSRAINLKVIYAKHSEMSVYKTFITIGQLVLVHSPRTH